MLSYLATVAQGPCLRIEVLLQVVSAIFDLSPSMATHLPVPLWKRCLAVVLDIMAILGQHPSIVVDEAYEGSAERTEEPSKPEDMKVPGSLHAVVERLDDELFKSLQVMLGSLLCAMGLPCMSTIIWSFRDTHAGKCFVLAALGV